MLCTSLNIYFRHATPVLKDISVPTHQKPLSNAWMVTIVLGELLSVLPVHLVTIVQLHHPYQSYVTEEHLVKALLLVAPFVLQDSFVTSVPLPVIPLPTFAH